VVPHADTPLDPVINALCKTQAALLAIEIEASEMVPDAAEAFLSSYETMVRGFVAEVRARYVQPRPVL